MYLYLKALHIIFIVTWFSGMFYIVRLYIYNTEANEKPEYERKVLQDQLAIMIKRLWLGITWPSALLTLCLGLWLLHIYGLQNWLWVKLGFVAGLYIYHLSLHYIYRQQRKGIFRYTSMQLRIWNEAATIFLVTIVILAMVKTSLSWVWGLFGLLSLMIVFYIAIRIYQIIRQNETQGG